MAEKVNIPGLQPRIFWGLTNGVKGNIHYVSDHDILYPAGGVLVVHNYVQKTQNYIKLPEPQKTFNIIALSPNRKVIAVAEEGDKPCISLYDVKTLKRKKILGLPFESGTKMFVSIAFTFDSKYLVAVTGDPNWTMVYYNWEKGKVESQTRANIPPTNPGPVTQVVPNPTDPTVVVIVGPGLFRLLSVSDTVWRQYGFQKADKIPICCVCWLNSDRVLAGTEDGRLIIVENGDLKGRFKACDFGEMDLQVVDENSAAQQVMPVSRLGIEPDIEVSTILAFANGFAFSTGEFIVVFEKETKFKYKRRHVFRIVAAEVKTDANKSMNTVLNLAVNPTQDRLIASTSLSQIYTVKLWESDNLLEPIPMKVLGEALHHGPITDLALCAWKTIFMTCGELDRTVRVWDFELECLIMSKQYEEDIYSLSLHPTGLYALVGFSDKLRFMLVLLDDLSTLREFPIRMCQEVSFSVSGHMFAAVNATTIQIYSSISFHCIYNLKGHNGLIRSLVWSSTDKSLFSCGNDGALYEWDIHDGQRIGDIITKKCQYADIAATQDGKMVYGVGSDGMLKEICNAEILREEHLIHHSYLYSIALSRSDLMMFVAGNRGAILSVRYPLPRPPEVLEHYFHKYPVTHMRLTNDDLNLISCSMDGTLCIWRLVNTERKAVKIDSDFQYSKEILINKEDLADKTSMIKYLENFVKSLETDHKYQVKEMETEHSEKTKELHAGYCAAIQDLKDKNQELIGEHTVEINKLNNNITELRREHNRAMENLESNYNAKLIVEYDKYAALENRSASLREDLLRDIAMLEKSKKTALKDMAEGYEEKLKAKDEKISELHDLQKQHEVEHEEIKQQIEYDADQEIIELKAHYEKLLITERDINIRLRGETGVMKKKFAASQREIEELKHKLQTLQGDQQQLKSLIATLKQDIANLKKEISERDHVIQENERKFAEVKNKNSELEKYKFVLNHKISELKMQIQPKEDEIQLKKEQIQDMEEEIQDRQREITTLELQAVEFREKMNEQEKENQRDKAKIRDLQATLRRIRTGLHNTVEVIQDPLRLKQMVVKIYHQYCGGKEFKHGRQQDLDAQSEFMRQRDYLERTVASLKNLYHKESTKKTSSGKIIKDNMVLIEELNLLRKELKLAQRQIRDLQSITGLHKFASPKEAQKKLQMAVKTREDIYEEYEDQLKESQRQIDLLEVEVQREMSKQNSKETTVENATQTLITKDPACIFDTYIGQGPVYYDFEDSK